MTTYYWIDEKEKDNAAKKIEVTREDGTFLISMNGTTKRVNSVQLDGNTLSLIDEHGNNFNVTVIRGNDNTLVYLNGERFAVTLLSPRHFRKRSRKKPKTNGGTTQINAPMPGKVVSLLVSKGEKVTEGQGLITIEAMKMENEIRSPAAGVVTDISVKPGDTVEARESLITVKSKS